MPLSEHEQRMLDEMERNLYGVESDVHPTSERAGVPNYTAVVWGVLVALAGLSIIIIGVMVQLIVLGIAGFAILFVGAMIATRRVKANEAHVKNSSGKTNSATGGRSSKRSGMTFMQRMEKRWDDRQ